MMNPIEGDKVITPFSQSPQLGLPEMDTSPSSDGESKSAICLGISNKLVHYNGEKVSGRESRLRKEALRMRAKRRDESEEQRQRRNSLNRERVRLRRECETEEQRERRLKVNREQVRMRRQNETEEERRTRLRKDAWRMRMLREYESEEQRELRRREQRERVRTRRKNETEEQREARRRKQRERVRLRRQKKTVKQRQEVGKDSAIRTKYERMMSNDEEQLLHPTQRFAFELRALSDNYVFAQVETEERATCIKGMTLTNNADVSTGAILEPEITITEQGEESVERFRFQN